MAAQSSGNKQDEFADTIEWLIGITGRYGCCEAELLEAVICMSDERSGLIAGLFYEDDKLAGRTELNRSNAKDTRFNLMLQILVSIKNFLSFRRSLWQRYS